MHNRVRLLLGAGFNPTELNPGITWDIAPNRTRLPQISAAHARYYGPFFDKWFPNETAFVTSIREPTSWFISHVNYQNRG